MATQEIYPPLSSEKLPSTCPTCSAPLAQDQRYCLNCGRRLVPLRSAPAEPGGRRIVETEEVAEGHVAPRGFVPPWMPIMAAAGAALAVLVLGLGLAVGYLLSDGEAAPVAAAPAPVIVQGGGGTSTPAAVGPVADEWPEGKDGWTVQLQTLPKTSDAAAVQAAKATATTQGATEVGVLDASLYDTLGNEEYVVYSGVYDSEDDANTALESLSSGAPGASVIEVRNGAASAAGASTRRSSSAKKKSSTRSSKQTKERAKDLTSGKKEKATVGDGELKELNKLSGKELSEKSAKLPKEIKTEGKAPAKDKKKAGGNTGSEGGAVIE